MSRWAADDRLLCFGLFLLPFTFFPGSVGCILGRDCFSCFLPLASILDVVEFKLFASSASRVGGA